MLLASATSLGRDIEPWASVGTAVCTLLLAMATVYLASKTGSLSATTQDELELLRTQAEAAQAQSRTAEAALRAQIKPVLLDVPPQTLREIPSSEWQWITRRLIRGEPSGRESEPRETRMVDASRIRQTLRLAPAKESPAEASFEVPVRNVGAGVARLGTVRIIFFDRHNVIVSHATANNLPVGEIAGLVFEMNGGEPGWNDVAATIRERLRIIATVDYTDSAGGQASRTELRLSFGDGKEPRLRVEDARVVDATEPLPTEEY